MNLTSLPIIGSLIAKGENLLAAGVQQVKEKVADFHLVPRRIQNFQARADQLSRNQVVNTSTDDVGQIVTIRNRCLALQSSYDTANRQLDLAMTEVNKVQAGAVSVTGAGLIASALASMNDVLGQAATIDNMLAAIEQRVLTPQQLANVKSLGLSAVSSSPISGKTLLGIGVVVGLALYLRRRRRR